jgi:hypothetical protein
MKIEIDKNGRTIYKFSHSVQQGGWLYVHNASSTITEKKELQTALENVRQTYTLFDTTTKIYDKIFFFFFAYNPSIAQDTIILAIRHAIEPLGTWSEKYVITGVYDLQEKYIRKDLEKWGFDYDQG